AWAPCAIDGMPTTRGRFDPNRHDHRCDPRFADYERRIARVRFLDPQEQARTHQHVRNPAVAGVCRDWRWTHDQSRRRAGYPHLPPRTRPRHELRGYLAALRRERTTHRARVQADRWPPDRTLHQHQMRYASPLSRRLLRRGDALDRRE